MIKPLSLQQTRLAVVFCITLGGAACSNVSQVQPTLDAIEAVQDILSESETPEIAPAPETVVSTSPVIVPPQSLWSYLGGKFELTQYKDHPRVKAEIARLQKHPRIVQHVANNAEPFLFYVVQELERKNLPLDLALLPAIESAYDPLAYSSGRAAGMWQFIESTGEMYGLHQTWWYDERRDVIASTEAALQYLHDLNTALKGNWLHAISAYNAGPNRIRNDIRRSIKKSNKHDFWSLDVPKETRRYIPKLIALAAVIESPEEYGFTLPQLKNEPYFEIVDAEIQLKLHTVADYLNVPPELIYQLNPGYNRHYTAPEGPHRLLVPADQKNKLGAMLAGISVENYKGEVTHTVAKGETLSHIASNYGVSINDLCDWNAISRKHVLSIGAKLSVKEGHNMGLDGELDRRAYTRKVSYQVRAGDSLYGIAQKFRVSVSELKEWNTSKLLNKQYLYPGENIRLFVDVTKVF